MCLGGEGGLDGIVDRKDGNSDDDDDDDDDDSFGWWDERKRYRCIREDTFPNNLFFSGQGRTVGATYEGHFVFPRKSDEVKYGGGWQYLVCGQISCFRP